MGDKALWTAFVEKEQECLRLKDRLDEAERLLREAHADIYNTGGYGLCAEIDAFLGATVSAGVANERD